ncbi:hypothetical protein FSP39_006387 [Pinctada imbricata]|uniref:Uncharacterized protein n=1 Tax=Pinctada imbricata TaxID=66713 RepID=A0AA88YCP9_PINIB|nr:hypothetical protein FSP39_006387 [Pinctada imbricata]
MKNEQTYQDSNIYDEIDSSEISLLENKRKLEKKHSTRTEKEKKTLLNDLASQSSSEEEGGNEENQKDLKNLEPKNNLKNISDNREKTSETIDICSPIADSGKKSTGFLGYYSMLENKAKEKGEMTSPETDGDSAVTTPSSICLQKLKFDINSPDSADSGIQSDARSDDGTHVHGPLNDDVYAVVDKSPKQESSEETTPTEEKSEDLPPGWQKCEDEDGPYYWHIKSGTIQREPPSPAPPDVKQRTLRSLSVKSDTSTLSTASNGSQPSTPNSVSSNTEEPLKAFEGHALQYAVKSLQNISSGQQARPMVVDTTPIEPAEKPARFAVRSLGWVRIAEEDLTPERSSRAVNKCIVDLSLGRNDINDVVGRWGDGKDLYLELDKESLRLIDPQDFSILNAQAIQSIRVWGVGRDNGRDFAYVARDKTTRKHMCHVFRCDTPARQIANALRDICKKIMTERRIQQNAVAQRLSRPTDLPNLDKNGKAEGQKVTFQSVISNGSFPTPMEEPKKVIRCHYIGCTSVLKPTGIDVLNTAIDAAYMKIPPEKWIFVNVAIAPSTITITEHGKPDNKIDECRVRFLSFMGIAVENIKLCGFIMHGAEDKFSAHIFHCEPSAGPLCKTIEAACKLRYQKCLDAHPQTPTPTQTKSKLEMVENLGSSLKSGVKAGAQTVQTGFKASVQGVQSMFSLIKSKVKSDSNQT